MHCLLWSIRSDNHSVLLWKVLFLSSVSSPDNKNIRKIRSSIQLLPQSLHQGILQVHDCVFLFFFISINFCLTHILISSFLLSFPQKYSIPVRVRQWTIPPLHYSSRHLSLASITFSRYDGSITITDGLAMILKKCICLHLPEPRTKSHVRSTF